VLRPIHPSVAIEMELRKRVLSLFDEMQRSVFYWIETSYRTDPPETWFIEGFAGDRAPREALERLSKRWTKKFYTLAADIARWYSGSVRTRVDGALTRILGGAGIYAKFRTTSVVRECLSATASAVETLVRAIPQTFFDKMQGIVDRAAQLGGRATRVLEEMKVTTKTMRRHVALWVRDQNSRATSALVRIRHEEIGVREAVWVHSGLGEKPRPTHVANSGNKYDVLKGWFDPAEKRYIHPGELINCRCVGRPVITNVV
jgi:hypothetical protein